MSVVDKSWGTPSPAGLRVRSNLGLDDRAAQRAAAREARAQARAGESEQRLKDRTAAREQDARAREAAREERRVAEQQLAEGDPHAAAAQRRRGSGRKDVVREQRDTRGYTTVVDVARMRELAKRGASVAGLAGAFGVSEEEVRAALADAE
ncbi:hypothetical protein [Sphingomonas sp. RIT328]|uniref:hypothetical protein n=1 Tax=Sphingomonas sp. RIT328 TaxID=1470591 RepID=UPI000AEDEEC9|nr:hypothetical protein [Sphingomonas sp. RIT328]